jgi:hypothetical protein
VYHGDYPEWRFIGRVGNQIVPNPNETQGTACEVWAAIPAVRKRNGILECRVNFVNKPVRSFGAVLADVRCDFIDIDERFRVKSVAAHPR